MGVVGFVCLNQGTVVHFPCQSGSFSSSHRAFLNPCVTQPAFRPAFTASPYSDSLQVLHRTRNPQSASLRFLPLHSACHWGHGQLLIFIRSTFDRLTALMDVGPGPQGYPHSEIHWGPPWTQHIVVVTVRIGFSDAERIHSWGGGERQVWGVWRGPCRLLCVLPPVMAPATATVQPLEGDTSSQGGPLQPQLPGFLLGLVTQAPLQASTEGEQVFSRNHRLHGLGTVNHLCQLTVDQGHSECQVL